MLRQINLQDERLTTLEAVSLAKMLSKREQYVRQGRAEEAHGLGTGIWILWITLTEGKKYDTGWDKL